MAFVDYYRILGLPHFYVTDADIQEAYHKRKDFFHPDNGHVTKDFSDIVTPQIEIAYNVLSDAKRKREYDKVLSRYVNEPLINTIPFETNQPKTAFKAFKKNTPFWNKVAYSLIALTIALLCAVGISWQVLQMEKATIPTDTTPAPAQTNTPKVSEEPPKLVVPKNPSQVIVPAVTTPSQPKANVSTEETWIVLPRPQNGHIFREDECVSQHYSYYYYYNDDSEFCAKTKGTQDYLVKLEAVGNENCFGLFYIRGGSEVLVDVKPGTYILKYACGDGDSWYGTEHKFGKNTSYARADNFFTFTSTEGWDVELYLQANGNLSQTYIDEDEF